MSGRELPEDLLTHVQEAVTVAEKASDVSSVLRQLKPLVNDLLEALMEAQKLGQKRERLLREENQRLRGALRAIREVVGLTGESIDNDADSVVPRRQADAALRILPGGSQDIASIGDAREPPIGPPDPANPLTSSPPGAPRSAMDQDPLAPFPYEKDPEFEAMLEREFPNKPVHQDFARGAWYNGHGITTPIRQLTPADLKMIADVLQAFQLRHRATGEPETQPSLKTS